MKNTSRLSAGLCNASILLYVLWLLLPAVQTTGRSYTGALAVALATSGDLAESVRFASGVAALKCTRPGGRAGIPDCDQTRSFLSLFV